MGKNKFTKAVDYLVFDVDWPSVGGTVVTLGVGALMAFGLIAPAIHDSNIHSASENLAESICERVGTDIAANDENFVAETDSIHISFIGATNSSIYSKSEASSTLDVYGSVTHALTDAESFVLKYDIEPGLQLSSSSEINDFAEYFSTQEASYVHFGSINELGAGVSITDSDSLSKSLSKTTDVTQDWSMSKSSMSPDGYLSIYGTPSVTCVDGKYYANVELTGVSCNETTELSFGAAMFSILAACTTYEETDGDMLATAAVGIGTSKMLETTSLDKYYNVRTLSTEITEEQALNLTDEQILRYVMAVAQNSPEKVNSEFTYYSSKLSKSISYVNSTVSTHTND